MNSVTGFDPNNVLTMELRITEGRFKKPEDLSRFLQQILQSVEAQPGGAKATVAGGRAGMTDGWQTDIAVEGYKRPNKNELLNVDWSIVTADYFQTMKLPILRGRTFTKRREQQDT